MSREILVEQYGCGIARTVIGCGEGDAALEWVCRQRDVDVVKLAG